MLNFLSQLLGKKSVKAQKAGTEKKKSPSVSQQAKQQALMQAGQLPDDDDAIVAFIMQCRFADARYLAAQKLKSEKAMEQVRTEMQKTDRRVYRLLQTRLQNKEQHEALNQEIYTLLAHATDLAQSATLTPNLVAELDRKWEALTKGVVKQVSDDMRHCFEQCHQKLAARLAMQLDLQREIRSCMDELTAMQASLEQCSSDSEQITEIFKERLSAWLNSSEQASLPRQLLDDFTDKLHAFEKLSAWHKAQHDAYRQRCEWLAQQECAEIQSLDKSQIQAEWKKLPEVEEPSLRETIDIRFEQLLLRFIAEQPTVADQQPVLDLDGEAFDSYIAKHVEGMEKSVASGAVQDALAHDDALRRIPNEQIEDNPELAKRLASLRGELRRLNDWAKWSGELSREKLVRFVQDLKDQSLTINELAETVMQAREQWKALNSVSGPASREQWLAFDTACNEVYEPVLEHAREQAEQRKENIANAEALIERIKKFSSDFKILYERAEEGIEPLEWKLVISFYRMTTQTWRQLGMVGRKEKKRLDDAFNEAMQFVREKLYAQTDLEIARREKIIEEVSAINPEQRDAGKLLRAIQQKWQEVARNFPLDNREDKKLWVRFREVCENLHEKRMAKNRAAEKNREEHLKQKQALCEKLEAVDSLSDAEEIQGLLADAVSQWKHLGSVPRDQEKEIHQRFDAACAKCRERVASLKTDALHQAMASFTDKLSVCCELESKIVDMCRAFDDAGEIPEVDDRAFEQRWADLPALPEKVEGVLEHRFSSALKALASCNRAYARRLVNNEDELANLLLRYEVIFEVPVEDDLAEQRKDMKLALLQETMSGAEEKTPAEVIRELLSIPAVVDEKTQKRLANLVTHLVNQV